MDIDLLENVDDKLITKVYRVIGGGYKIAGGEK